MKIKIIDLKEFFKRSNKIKASGIMPILDYLKFEFTKDSIIITKTNNSSYCRHTIEQDNEETGVVLVEEKRLSAFASNVKGEYISFSVKAKQIILKDDANKLCLSNEDPKNFPAFPESEDGEKVILNPDVLAALFEARLFVSSVDGSYAYVAAYTQGGKNFVYATNGHLFYRREIEYAIPALSLSASICATIAEFQHVEYFRAGNYDFFDTGKTMYGFIKSEYKAATDAATQIIGSMVPEMCFTVNKVELADFCALVNSLAVSKIPTLRIYPSEEGLTALYEEPEVNLSTEKELEVSKDCELQKFALNAAYLVEILKCFSCDKINITTNPAETLKCFEHPEEKGLKIIIAQTMY